MNALWETWRRVYSVPRQLASTDIRRKALATLKPGDVVRAVDVETQDVVGDRRLTLVDWVRGVGGATPDEWPLRYVAQRDGYPDWLADDEGRQLGRTLEYMSGGWILIRPWLLRPEVPEMEPKRVAYSQRLWDAHLESVALAVARGDTDMPDEPWTYMPENWECR